MSPRARSSLSAAGNRSGSRFAEPMTAITRSPRRIVCEPTSTSVVAQRVIERSTGLSKRRSSSTASGSPAGFARSFSSSSGCLSSASTLFPMRLTVVSCPATIRSTTMLKSSSSLSVSPASSACTSALTRSSPGSARRCSKRPCRYARNCSTAAPKACCSSSVSAGLTNRFDHWRNRSRSSDGMPSNSQITTIGSGNAKSSTRFISPRGSTASISSSAISWTRGRSPSTMRGVNAFETRRRRRRWSSPSFIRRCELMRGSICSSNAVARASSSSGVSASAWSSTKRSSSRRTAIASSCRVTNQIGVVPSRPGCLKTGSCSRIAVYVSCVCSRNSYE